MRAEAKRSLSGGSEPSSISAALLDRTRGRQPEAWRRLVDLFGPVIYGWCRQAGLTRDDAPDLVQEVFAAVALNIDAFHRDQPGESFTAWLSTVTRNMIRDHFRSRRGQPVAQGGSESQQRLLQVPEPSAAAEPSDPQSRSGMALPVGLELARAEFESHTWEAFRRVVLQRQPPVQVATELEMSIQAVYQAKSRVLRRLRRELDGLMDS